MALSPLHEGCNGPLVGIAWAEVERWDGPPDARLYCCACGAGIRGTDAEVEAARLADAEYEASEGAQWPT